MSEAEILQAAQADWWNLVKPKPVRTEREYDACNQVILVKTTFDDGHTEQAKLQGDLICHNYIERLNSQVAKG